jgi:hypothetical protein
MTKAYSAYGLPDNKRVLQLLSCLF